MTPDLPAYFRRIGFDGTPRADRTTLAALVRCHAAAIPFESLGPLLGEPVRLDLPSLERKLVHDGRGGYCFEHNALLRDVLQALGFEVTALAARVLWNRPADAPLPRTHMLLQVRLPEGPQLVDVGFGGLTLTGVLALQPDVTQATPHEPFRLQVDGDGGWRVDAQLRGAWLPLYGFDLQRQLPVDFEPPNHYMATHPQSRFVQNLVCARAPAGRRLALLNREFRVHRIDGPDERRRLETPAQLREVMEHEFLIRLPCVAALDRRLAELPWPDS